MTECILERGLEFTRFSLWLQTECDYSDVVDMGNGMYACLRKFIHTTAIITGVIGDTWSTEERWCYHDVATARRALYAWQKAKFKGEPDGWHRHPATGRRRDGTGKEWVAL